MVKKDSYRSCLFLVGLLCSHRRSKRVSMNDSYLVAKYCVTCPHYIQFMREMDAEDEREMAEIDRIMEHGYDAQTR